ncbi:MAG: tyrosine-type recombinase/integrase [Paracoccaceae bacterium]|nr:tyrosine-type recombinase/integrase [Paracoccaceae bacterium]
MALRYKEIEAAAADKRQKMLPDGTPNLYAFIRSSGSVFWTVRLMVEGKRTNLSIGKWPDIKADEARRITPSVKSAIAAGYGLTTIKNALAVSLDPVVFNGLLTGERVSASEATPTFQVVARRWYEDHLRDGLSAGPYKRQVIQQVEDHVFPRLGERPINEIRRKEIVEALRMLWIDKRPTAQKVRGNIERIFDYAIDLEFREDNPTPPPRSMPVAQHQVRHFASMPHERAGELWTWLHDRPRMSIQTRVGLSLALLLGKRTGEIRHMEWTEIDFEHGIWSTPADKMKKRKAHRQPLSSQALQLLREVEAVTGQGRYVLGNAQDKPMSENAMLYGIKRFDNVTVHGLRASLGSWMEESGVRKPVADFVKAHQPKYLDAAYQRSDLLEERREVLQRWADYVTSR